MTSRVFEPKLKASVQEARLGERTATCYGQRFTETGRFFAGTWDAGPVTLGQ
ncbi:MAG: hypothetical protein ACYC6N_31175 [Pirellulaceae bacterium]